jgi:hypothetical protein
LGAPVTIRKWENGLGVSMASGAPVTIRKWEKGLGFSLASGAPVTIRKWILASRQWECLEHRHGHDSLVIGDMWRPTNTLSSFAVR